MGKIGRISRRSNEAVDQLIHSIGTHMMASKKWRLLWIDVGYACGGIYVNENNIVVGGAPIFNRWLGRSLEEYSKLIKKQVEMER